MKNLSNTTQRIISALILVGIIALLVFVGGRALEYFMVVVSLLLLDELLSNFLEIKMMSEVYLICQGILLFFTFLGAELLPTKYMGFLIIGTGIPLSLLAFVFLFKPENLISKLPFIFSKKMLTALTCLSVCVFWGGLALILRNDLWIELLVVLLFTTYATDSFAWLIGKSIGKTPLWSEVSPKKTREGAIGGYICGAITGLFLWYTLIDSRFSLMIVGIALLPFIAQLGDLTQSRIKRWVGIKDSSNLIPGHGGIFDRVDSLMLVIPFFIAIIWGHFYV